MQIRASTKRIKRDAGWRDAYRGVLRDENDTIVWSCTHTHEARSWTGYGPGGLFERSALDCAQEAMRIVAIAEQRRAAAQPGPRVDGGDE
jgi:hypothetical protein